MNEQLKEEDFSLKPALKFTEDAQGLKFIEIDNALATAKIALQGAHIMQWQPKSAAHPVLWLSSQARNVKGRSIRGGVPICWPWFGVSASVSSHGITRAKPCVQ